MRNIAFNAAVKDPVAASHNPFGIERENLPPVVFQNRPHQDVSHRYEFIPTIDVVERLAEEGFEPVAYSVAGTRDWSREGFQRHALSFRHRDLLGKQDQLDHAPEIVVGNSHDRGSSYTVAAGVFRFICSNGMILADEGAAFHRVRHQGLQVTIDNVVAATLQAAHAAGGANDRIEQWTQTRPTLEQATAFVVDAHRLRWESPEAAPVRPEALFAARRGGDTGSDAWSVLNRVQENLLRGGLMDQERRWEFRRQRRRYVTPKAVTAINDRLRINQGVWAAAEEHFALN